MGAHEKEFIIFKEKPKKKTSFLHCHMFTYGTQNCAGHPPTAVLSRPTGGG